MKLLPKGKPAPKQRRHLLFTYGTMMTGNRNRDRIKDGKYEGVAYTPARYTLWCLGYAPGAVMRGKTAVHGEVYWIDDDLLRTVDGCEGTPWKYKRQQIDVIVVTKKGERRMRAWIYVLLDEWADYDGRFVIEDGKWTQPKDWAKHYLGRAPKYRGGSVGGWLDEWDDYENVGSYRYGYERGLDGQTLGEYDPGEVEELFTPEEKGKPRTTQGWFHVQKQYDTKSKSETYTSEPVGFLRGRGKVGGKDVYEYVWNGWVWDYDIGKRLRKATAADYEMARLPVPSELVAKPEPKPKRTSSAKAVAVEVVKSESEIPDFETECDRCGGPLVWDRETDRYVCPGCLRDVDDMIDADVRRYSLLDDDEPDDYEREMIEWQEMARHRALSREHPTVAEVQAVLRAEASDRMRRHRRNGKSKRKRAKAKN